jgi:hypothetical protein
MYKTRFKHRCTECNRELTDPESIQLGMGPICKERLNLPIRHGLDLWDMVWEREMDEKLVGGE